MDPNKPGQQVSGDDFDNLLRTVVSEEVAKMNRPAGAQDSPQDAGIKINVGGQEYHFKTQEELNAALNQTFTGYAQQLAQLQAQMNESSQPGQHVQGDEAPTFDMKHYIGLMEKDAIKAAEYVDSHRYFGGKVENPSTVIREQLMKSAELERVVAAYQFKDAHPEYQPSPENAQVIEKVRSALGLPATFDGLEAAYATAITKGFLPDPRMEQLKKQMQDQQTQTQPQLFDNMNRFNNAPPQRTMITPPPVPSNAGLSTGMQSILNQAQDLDMGALEKILKGVDMSQLH